MNMSRRIGPSCSRKGYLSTSLSTIAWRSDSEKRAVPLPRYHIRRSCRTRIPVVLSARTGGSRLNPNPILRHDPIDPINGIWEIMTYSFSFMKLINYSQITGFKNFLILDSFL